MSSAADKGDLVYSIPLELPPAILEPSLTLNYSSAARMDLEMSYGWSLGGITEISRPLMGHDIRDKDEWHAAEWMASGPDFSGILKPSSDKDGRFFMSSSSPVYVSAQYNQADNDWVLSSNGITYSLAAADHGADTEAGTERWRVIEASDTKGNYITYCYDHDGRIQDIAYGGNKVTNEQHLLTIAFSYGKNTVTQTNARGRLY